MKEAACVRAAQCRTRGRWPPSSSPEACRLPATSLFLMRSVHGCVTDGREAPGVASVIRSGELWYFVAAIDGEVAVDVSG